MPPKAPESKAAKLAKAAAGGKAKKKKWSKGKTKEKAQNQVLFEQSALMISCSEVPKYKMITVSILCDRLRITCSLARKGIAILVAKGLIKPVIRHSQQDVYTSDYGSLSKYTTFIISWIRKRSIKKTIIM